MTEPDDYTPPTHFLSAPAPGAIKRISCGRNVPLTVFPPRYTTEVRLASCFQCAEEASDLTTEERQRIWDNANERLDSFRRSPWEKAAARAKRYAARLARRAKAAEGFAR